MPDYLDNAVRSFSGMAAQWVSHTQRAAIPAARTAKGKQLQSNAATDQNDEEGGFGFFFAGTSQRPHLRPFRVIYPDLSPIGFSER
jgi:hypothetical protein